MLTAEIHIPFQRMLALYNYIVACQMRVVTLTLCVINNMDVYITIIYSVGVAM